MLHDSDSSLFHVVSEPPCCDPLWSCASLVGCGGSFHGCQIATPPELLLCIIVSSIPGYALYGLCLLIRSDRALPLQFIDDVEFWFKPGKGSRVEYRSASRIGESDGNINRKRIKTIRQALETKGWASTGF